MTAADLTVVPPAGYVDQTAGATPNSATGKPPEVELTGPATPGGRPVFRADRLPGNEPLTLVVPAVRSELRSRLHATMDPSGVQRQTVAGEQAQGFGYKLTTEGHPLHGRELFVAHNGVVYALVFTTPAADYSRDLGDFNAILASLRWR